VPFCKTKLGQYQCTAAITDFFQLYDYGITALSFSFQKLSLFYFFRNGEPGLCIKWQHTAFSYVFKILYLSMRLSEANDSGTIQWNHRDQRCQVKNNILHRWPEHFSWKMRGEESEIRKHASLLTIDSYRTLTRLLPFGLSGYLLWTENAKLVRFLLACCTCTSSGRQNERSSLCDDEHYTIRFLRTWAKAKQTGLWTIMGPP
jgi:hypothetical protein